MIDINKLRDNSNGIINAISTKGADVKYLKTVLKNDEERRTIIKEVETLKSEKNAFSKNIGKLKREGKDITETTKQIDLISNKIKALDEKLGKLDKKINEALAKTPNIPLNEVPVGKDENDNVEVRKHLKPTKFNFTPKAHWDLGVDLDIIDFERGVKLTGSRFTVLKGQGARLERALINYMLDKHVNNGYKEVLPPFIANKDSLYGTGNLPKFEDDLFKLTDTNYYLIPTAEVPITNLHRSEFIDSEQLPLKYVAYTPCFRSEAGSAGRDTRGIIRQHQFNKVEVVKVVKPENALKELDLLVKDAQSILEDFEIPYRTVKLCTGDLGFSNAITYDIEVWLPSYNEYKEISSCSCYTDFQARRMNMKYKDGKKKHYPYTLNGSALAIGRTMAAILENYQNEDGSINIPKKLQPYMGNNKIISK